MSPHSAHCLNCSEQGLLAIINSVSSDCRRVVGILRILRADVALPPSTSNVSTWLTLLIKSSYSSTSRLWQFHMTVLWENYQTVCIHSMHSALFSQFCHLAIDVAFSTSHQESVLLSISSFDCRQTTFGTTTSIIFGWAWHAHTHQCRRRRVDDLLGGPDHLALPPPAIGDVKFPLVSKPRRFPRTSTFSH